ncbi:MAG: uroporphyrinogen-III C-methyltransferase [Candidatus Angelobacter sp.]
MGGKVYIVGAGPGAPDLLTIRAARLLHRAEVVLHDDLVPAAVLELAPPAAHILNVGKRCGQEGSSQEKINALMIWHARNGSTVVRLKSGDPAIFGRLGEELDALQSAAVEFEVVPGVTAASAAAAVAGLTLTDRRAASAVAFVTAHSSRNKPLTSGILDTGGATYVVYMPGPDYGETARNLLRAGIDANTPCALVSQAGRLNGQACRMTVADLPFATGVLAPALLIVGKVSQRESVQRAPTSCQDALRLDTRDQEPVSPLQWKAPA